MKKEELLEKIEERHEINAKSGDTLVWVLDGPLAQDQAESIREELDRILPEQAHVVIDNLDDLYRISTEEEE